MKKLIATLLLTLSATSFAFQQRISYPVNCVDFEEAVTELSRSHKEISVWVGVKQVDGTDFKYMLFTNSKNKSWTLGFSVNDKLFCVLGIGQGFTTPGVPASKK